MSDNELNFLVERLGPQYRRRIQQALQWEEDKAFERALEEWEAILGEARREGRDVGSLQERIQRLHKLWWQQKGRAVSREAPALGPAAEEKPRTGGRPREAEEKDREAVAKELKNRIRFELQSRCLNQGISVSSTTQENRLLVRGVLDRLIKEKLREIPEWLSRRDLLEGILADVCGLGLLESHLNDPSISEVMVNGLDIYCEREGRLFTSPMRFHNSDEVREIVERILQPIGRRVDESSPMVDARLPDGSRVNIVLAPVALDGPIVTIRKFSRFRFTEEALIEAGTFSKPMAGFFRLAVRNRLNVMVAGKTSSGKTTLLNLLGGFVPAEERVILIEDVAELHLPQRHVVRLEARPPNIQGKGEITIRTLFRNALHMRPDRVIVGECRGAETLDMLQAMNTGHDGSLSTAHANSPADLFSRLEAMVGMAEVPIGGETVRSQIASGIDIVIYCTRFSDGQRKVTSVCEVLKQPTAGGAIGVEEIFGFERRATDATGGVHGDFVARGRVPGFVAGNVDLAEDRDVLALFGEG